MTNGAEYDERFLLDAVAKGDRKAFNELYSAHLNNVFHFIFLFTKSKEDTEELIQDLFVNMWEKREKLAEVDSFKNYLFRAAKNRLISNVRHMQVKHRVLSEIKRSRESSDLHTENTVAYKEYYKIVQQAIAKLPPKRKLIFRLNTENGLSHDEIATKLGISKSVVKNQLYKAYDFVRQYLADYGVALYFILLTPN